MYLESLFLEHRIKLFGNLTDHHFKINTVSLQRDIVNIESGDFEKFVDKLFKPVRLFKRNSRILCPLCKRNFRAFVKQRQIADNACQRRLQIVRQIHDKVVFSRFRLSGKLLGTKDVMLNVF